MSVDATSLPSPAFYSYPSTLPSALTAGSGSAATASGSSSSGSGTAASNAASPAASGASPLSSYEAEYDTLQTDDTEELMNVSLGSTANAQSNLAGVLAQAAALQDAQLATQQQQAATDADAAVQSSTASAPSASSSASPALPTLQSIVAQSDSDASTNLGNYQSSGSSIDLLA